MRGPAASGRCSVHVWIVRMPRVARLRLDDGQQRLLGALAPVLGVDHQIELERR